MGFISSLVNPDKGAGFQAVNADTKIGPANDQVQNAIKQQQSFVDAISQNQALTHQFDIYGQQQNLANQLQGVANGTGPNPALAQLNQATGQNVANQAALMASQRGTGANAGALARLAAMQGGNIQQQAAGQGATLQAQQQLTGMNALAGQQAQLANTAQQQVGNQQAGLNALQNAGLQNQSNIMGLQANANSANAGVAGVNAQAQAGILGGVLNGAGLAVKSLFHKGGQVRGYDVGGDVQPKSDVGKIMNGFDSMGGTNAGALALNKGVSGLSSGLASTLQNAFASKQGPQTMTMAGGPMDAMGPAMDAAPVMAMAYQGGEMEPQGRVPGKAPVPNDNVKNDIVPAKLSPGEIVIPRSIAMHPDAPNQAAMFVAKILHDHKMACGGMYADGGQATNSANNPPNTPDPQKARDADINVPGHGESFAKGWENAKKFIQNPMGNLGKAHGGVIQNYKEGGRVPIPLNSEEEKTSNPSEDEDPALDKEIRNADIIGNYEVNGPTGMSQLANIYGTPNPSAMPMGNYVQTPGAQAGSPVLAPQQGQSQAQPRAPQSVQDILANKNYNQGLQQEITGLGQQSEAQQNIQREMAPQIEQAQKVGNTVDAMVLKNVTDEKEHGDAIFKDWLDGKIPEIDPNRFIKNMGTTSKVGTAIGLILGGIGGGLTHQENPVMKFLQSQVDNDVRAQEANINNKKSLMGALHQYYGDRNTAMLAYQNFKLKQLDLAMQVATTKNGSLLAKSQYNLASGPIREKIDQNNNAIGLQKFVMQQGQSGQGGQGQLSPVDPSTLVPIMAKDEPTQKAIFEEIKNRQNISANGPKMMDAFDRAANEQTMMRTGGGMLRTSPSLKELHQLMLPNFKSIDGTVRQAAMDESFHNIDPSAGDFGGTTSQKREALKNWISSESAAPVAMGHGLNLDNYSKTAQKLPGAPSDRVERLDPRTGKIGVFDSKTKQFLGYK